MKLSVEGIEFSYRSRKTLNEIEFEVSENDVVSILGPNGVGKTTLLKCLDNILKPDSGIISIDEKDITPLSRNDIAKEIGYVPQRGEPSRMTVFESVLLGRKPHIKFDASEKDIRIASRTMDLVGLTDLSDRYVDEISGGEYQLVQIARSFTQQPKIILLDEPTNNLDPSNQHKIMHIIQRVTRANNMAAIMVVHDLNLAIRHSNKFILMKKGKIYAAGGLEVITPENIKAVYDLDSYVEKIHGVSIVIPKTMVD